MPRGRPRKHPLPVIVPRETIEEVEPEVIVPTALGPEVPEGWHTGELLNVRNHGDAYVLTLFPAEFDPRHPERAMRFTNPGDCQNFVSKWYSRESADPRAR